MQLCSDSRLAIKLTEDQHSSCKNLTSECVLISCKEADINNKEKKKKDNLIVVLRRAGRRSWSGCSFLNHRNKKTYHLLGERRRGVSAAVGDKVVSFCNMGQMVESAGLIVGCKVLPICDSRGGISADVPDHGVYCSSVSSEQKGERRKAIARMKEIWRRAAPIKSPIANRSRKVSVFGNKGGAPKSSPMDELSSINSSKISLRLEDDDCSPTAVVPSEMLDSGGDRSLADQEEEHETRLNWITTDSDFVVLELCSCHSEDYEF